MINRFLVGAGLAMLAAQTPLSAQDAPPPPPPPGMGPMAMMPPATRAEAEKRAADRFAALDLDKDGVVTRDEIEKAGAARREAMEKRMAERHKEHVDRAFAALDTDKNGAISRAEFEAAPSRRGMPGAMAMGGPPLPPGARPMMRGMMMMHAMAGGFGMMEGRAFDRADANHDGKLTAAEAKTAALAMFDRFDTNHDGTISPEERRMAFRGMIAHGRHGPDGAPLPPVKG